MRVLRRLLLLGFALTMIASPRAAAQPAPPADGAPSSNTGKDPARNATNVPAPDARDAAKKPSEDGDAQGEHSEDELSKSTLTIKLKSKSGAAIEEATVFIDDRSMGEIEDGELTLTNIPQGPHAVAVVARGFQRFEKAMTLRDGEKATLDALLLDVPPPHYSPVWYWTLGTSLAVLGGGFGYWYHARERLAVNFDAVRTTAAQRPDGSGPYEFYFPPQTADCGRPIEEIERQKRVVILNLDRFERACTWRTRRNISFIAGTVGGVGTFVSLLMLIRHRVVQGELPLDQRKNRRQEVVILPTVTPGAAGATLMLTW